MIKFLDAVLHLPVFLFDVCTNIDVIDNCKETAEKPFICPNCGKEFYKKWSQLYFNGFDPKYAKKAILKCPHCKEKDACRWTGVDRI